LVVHLARILGINAGDAHGGAQALDQLILQSINRGQNPIDRDTLRLATLAHPFLPPSVVSHTSANGLSRLAPVARLDGADMVYGEIMYYIAPLRDAASSTEVPVHTRAAAILTVRSRLYYPAMQRVVAGPAPRAACIA